MKGLFISIVSALLLIFICVNIYGQKQQVYGKVIDEITQKGIANTNISFAGTQLGGATDKNGEFSIVTDTLPVYMIISHIGYETRRIWLENASGGMTILMKPEVSILKEIVVSDKNEPQVFFKDEQYAVLDYEVDNIFVYLLIYRFRMAKSELLCKSIDGDTVAHSCLLPFKPNGLYHDCLGNIHVLSSDSAYQVYLRKDTLILLYRADIWKFKATLLNCVASTPDWLIIREESADHQIVNFSRIHRLTKRKQYFASVRDDFNLNMLRKNPSDYIYALSDTMPDGNEALFEWAWVNKILYKPNASVLKKIGDTFAVFNTTNCSFDLYDQLGRLIPGSAMHFALPGGERWTKEICFDEISKLSYTTFMKNGRLIIYRINLETGELKRILTTMHLFPEKIRIHHDYLFYLYDLPNLGDNKHLYRQKL